MVARSVPTSRTAGSRRQGPAVPCRPRPAQAGTQGDRSPRPGGAGQRPHPRQTRASPRPPGRQPRRRREPPQRRDPQHDGESCRENRPPRRRKMGRILRRYAAHEADPAGEDGRQAENHGGDEPPPRTRRHQEPPSASPEPERSNLVAQTRHHRLSVRSSSASNLARSVTVGRPPALVMWVSPSVISVLRISFSTLPAGPDRS